MSSSILSSQGIALATAMAVSGTFILLVLRLQKPILSLPPSSTTTISSDDDVKEKKTTKRKKRVHFAEDVVEPTGNSEDYRRLHSINTCWGDDSSCRDINKSYAIKSLKGREMPANGVALYNGILRDRVHKMNTSY